MATSSAKRHRVFRSSRHIVGYWENGEFVLHQFASGRRAVVHLDALQVLNACREWTPLDAIVKSVPSMPAAWVRRAVKRLADASFIHRSDDRYSSVELAYDRWGAWGPVAAFFHSATRGVEWPDPELREQLELQLRAKADLVRPPAPVKTQRRLKQVALPSPRSTGEFPSVLLARRTWRGFSKVPVSLVDLSTLLWLTSGVQMWGESSAGEPVPFKTSPSAGAKHPIELYVLARNVRGLPRGIYHYACDQHRLGLVSRGLTTSQIQRFLGNQWQFRDAGLVVVMTAVVARTQWTYSTPRAFRSVLAEAGHVCQTFCLVATWLNLAPFCTMALADHAVEKALKIDGVAEIVLYAAGASRKPANGRWVQWPSHAPGRPYLPPNH